MLELEFTTIEEWDEALWARMERIYHEAFQSGAKTKAILRSMLDRKIGYLHTGVHRGEVVAMAVTGLEGKVADRILIIDYLAVEQKMRGWGIGTWMLGLTQSLGVKGAPDQRYDYRGGVRDNRGSSGTHTVLATQRVHPNLLCPSI